MYQVFDLDHESNPTAYLRKVASNGTAPVPEPATMLLYGTGIVGLVGTRFRKKN